jgi:hypothetical protein
MQDDCDREQTDPRGEHARQSCLASAFEAMPAVASLASRQVSPTPSLSIAGITPSERRTPRAFSHSGAYVMSVSGIALNPGPCLQADC